MENLDKITLELFAKYVMPVVLGLIGWFVKDYLFAIYAKRDEMVRKEWEKRLVEIWDPLYYWSGIILLDEKAKGWSRHGLDELEKLLAKSAHLVPEQHYINLIKVIQAVTNQKTALPSLQEIKRTRQFIYGQVQTYNYLLYKRGGWFDATTYTDFLASAKYLVRFTSYALKHLFTWLAIIVLLGGTYLAYVEERYWTVALVLGALIVPVLYDWYRHIRLHHELSRRTAK